MTSLRALYLLVPVTLAGCDRPPLEASCAGETIELCAPYEYAEARAAILEPNELPIADFTMSAHMYVELARCTNAPAPHVVELSAIVPDPDPSDGGVAVRVIDLLTLAEGADGDVAGDGAIDVNVPSPFLSTVPAETDITLRFTARSTAPGGCTGGHVDIPYRTGPPAP